MKTCRKFLVWLWLGALVPIWMVWIATVGSADEYVAFSLAGARQRIDAAAGEDWRREQPEVFKLAGVNKIRGFVYDREDGDLILVGKRDPARADLTLDDVVVALRARCRYQQWPLVSIGPAPDTEETQMQRVCFKGGIRDTGFGSTVLEADHLLKRVVMGLEEAGVVGLQTYWDRTVEEIARGSRSGS